MGTEAQSSPVNTNLPVESRKPFEIFNILENFVLFSGSGDELEDEEFFMPNLDGT